MHAPPGTFRAATALEAGTIVLAAGAEAGKAFTPSGWEDFYVAFALLARGETGQARATMEEALAREPERVAGPVQRCVLRGARRRDRTPRSTTCAAPSR